MHVHLILKILQFLNNGNSQDYIGIIMVENQGSSDEEEGSWWPHIPRRISESIPSGSEIAKGIVHETVVTLLGSFLFNITWGSLVHLIGLDFPLMNLFLLVVMCFLFPFYDKHRYPTYPPNRVYVVRISTNFVLLAICMSSLAAWGVSFSAELPNGLFPLLRSCLLFAALISAMRIASNISVIAIAYFVI